MLLLSLLVRYCRLSYQKSAYNIYGGTYMEILKNIAALIKVKTIVTLVVIAVFAYLALTGAITADNVMIVVSTVIAFYFGTQHEKK